MKNFIFKDEHIKKFIAVLFLLISVKAASSQQLLRVAVAGLSHDHVNNIMQQFKRAEVIIVGIAEADQQLAERYKNKFQLPDSIFF